MIINDKNESFGGSGRGIFWDISYHLFCEFENLHWGYLVRINHLMFAQRIIFLCQQRHGTERTVFGDIWQTRHKEETDTTRTSDFWKMRKAHWHPAVSVRIRDKILLILFQTPLPTDPAKGLGWHKPQYVRLVFWTWPVGGTLNIFLSEHCCLLEHWESGKNSTGQR